MSFGTTLKQLRTENGLTQKELASMIGVHKSAVSFWEQDINEPKISYAVALSKVFNISTDELLSDLIHDGVNS